VTVSNTQAYYGENDSGGNDEHPAEMVIEAIKLADSQVNFADYDWDGNGTVEQVYVVYAGKGEADGGAANTIWPHEYDLYSANYYGDGEGKQKLDGVWINTYACGGELNGSGNIAGIGTMCHEFSHCLGFPDFYDTDYSGGQGMGYWDLMCSGSYNGGGYQPAGYTSYERWVAGWKEPTELVYTQTISDMAALQTTGSDTYIIYNKANSNEYYLLENRQKTGWDASLPGEGLLILHVDYNENSWKNNKPNDDPDHQRMTWIPADNEYQYTESSSGSKSYTKAGMATDPFPYGTVNAFGKNTTPAAKLYNKNSDNTYYLDSSIENITQNSDAGKTVSFHFVGESNVDLPTFSPNGGRFAMDQTVTVTINGEAGATIYYTTDGSTPTTSSTQYTDLFTVTATTTVKAIAVKNGESSGVASATYTFVEPFITADESLTFSTNVGTPQTKTLTVLTEGLTQNVTLTLTDANNVFSLDATTISKSLEYATVDVTFSPTAAGNYSGSITLTSTGADPVTVSLSATASIPVPTAPTGLALSDVTSDSFTASWTAVDNATSYEIDVVEGVSFEPSAGGTVLASDFSDTSGWTLTGTGTYTGAGYYGSASPSIKFDGTGDYAISPDFGSGVKLQFWAYGNGGSGSTFAISGLVNDTWTDIETVTIAQAGATYEVDLPAGTSQVRFDFTKSVNCALDDVVVYGPGNSPESVDGYPKSVGNVTSYDVTDLTSGTQYAVRVRAVNDGGNSDWSATATATTIANIAPVWSALPTNVSVTLGGDDYEITVSDYVTGTPTPTFSMIATANSADYDFDPIDGYFTFTPSATGTFTFTFTATNSAGSANATLTVTVGQPQSSSGDEFALITKAADFVEGDYIIVYNNGAMKASVTSNRLDYAAVTPSNNVITTDDATIIWHIAPSGNYYTIYNAGENKYAAATGSNNQAQLLTSGTDDKSLWSVTTGTTFEFVNKNNAANSVNANLRRNGTYGFACYSTQTGGALSLYKRISGGIDPAIAYYQNADGKQGAALKTAMCGIIYNRTEQDYDDLWTAYQTTDVRSDGKIWDMYSNITAYDPVNGSHANSAEGSGFNREHSFPKSWFGGEVTPMYTDLHHLYPVDGNINTRRSNNPYGETNGEDYKSTNGFSKLGTCTYPGYTGKVFEPADEYKGDFARTYFYMVTCYEEKLHDWYTNYSSTTEVDDVLDGRTYPGFQTWQLNMLMKWAKNDPVSEKETARNNAVYAIQNNRNPFIDYPGLEEYVWGSMTTTAFSYDNYVQPVYKQDVTMSFSPTEATATLGVDFTEPTLTIDPDGLTVAYSSSEPSVATVDAATGEVTLVAGGTTTITATFAGDETYNSGSASYTLNVSNPSLAFGETLLYEGVTTYNGSDSSTALTTTSDYLNYKNWSSITRVYPGGNAHSNGGCLKFGSSNGAGSMTTGSISLTGGGTLTFYLKQYGSDTGKLKVTVTGAIADVTEFNPASTWTLCTVNLTKATGTVTIKLETTANRAYVDEITLTSNNKLILANNGDNATNIAAAATNGGKFDVTLKDRTLYRDGKWNTLCLPFDVNMNTDDCLLHSHGLTVMTLDGTTSKFDNGTLTLNFITVYDGDTYKGDLVAGTPYIIKWTGGQQHLTNPVFYGVTIDNDLKPVTASDGSVTFAGIYDYMTFTDATASILFLGSGNNLYYPLSDAKIGAQRAYFQLNNGITVDVNNARMCFGDEKTEIVSHSSPLPSHLSGWYTLDGRKLDGVGTDVKGNLQSPLPVRLPKGIYIHNGRKVVIK
jgi:M6 family metalloprotease-like protein